jgi:AraC-like DNA-binding protein
LLRWRLALAKDELRRGRLSLSEIALAVGFQSASAFNTAFSRATGLSPRRYALSAARPSPA